MTATEIQQYFSKMSSSELIQLAEDLNTTAAEFSDLVRKHVYTCYPDTSYQFHLNAIALGIPVAGELANRFKKTRL